MRAVGLSFRRLLAVLLVLVVIAGASCSGGDKVCPTPEFGCFDIEASRPSLVTQPNSADYEANVHTLMVDKFCGSGGACHELGVAQRPEFGYYVDPNATSGSSEMEASMLSLVDQFDCLDPPEGAFVDRFVPAGTVHKATEFSDTELTAIVAWVQTGEFNFCLE
jgi:hypothetical protein